MKTRGKNIFGSKTIEKSIKATHNVFVKDFEDVKVYNGKLARYTVRLRPQIKIRLYKLMMNDQLKGTIIVCDKEYAEMCKELILSNFKDFISYVDENRYVCLFETISRSKIM